MSQRSTPSVSVNAVVFFQTEEQAEQYATILSDIVTKVLVVFNACSDTSLSFHAKQQWIKTLTTTQEQLQQLEQLDAVIAEVSDSGSAIAAKFQEKLALIRGCTATLSMSLKKIEQHNESRDQSVALYKSIFEDLLKLLQLNVDLLRLQREQKVQNILEITQSALMSLKQLSRVTTQSDLSSVISDTVMFLNEISTRTQVLADVTTNSQKKKSLEDGVTSLRAHTNKLSTLTITSTAQDREVVVQQIVQCVSPLLATLQQPEDFSSVFSVEYEGGNNNNNNNSNDALTHIQQHLDLLSQYVKQGLVHESSTTAASIVHAVQSGVASSAGSADLHLQNAYKNLQEKLADLVKNVKQALASHQSQNNELFQQQLQALEALIMEMQEQSALARRRKRDSDDDFDLLNAARMVMQAINGLSTSQ